jgi:photosynthesis system II assembly factor YCF48-like protein
MAHDDRDRNFQKALARTLRDETAESPTLENACADAETLAAYHKSSLPMEQLALLKQHIAGCTRCEEILTQLSATEEIPLAVAAAERRDTAIPASRSQLASPWQIRYWQWLVPAGALAAGLLVWISLRQPTPPRVEMANNQAPTARAEQPSALGQPFVSPAPAEDKSKDSTAIGGAAENRASAPGASSGALKPPEKLSRPANKSHSLLFAPRPTRGEETAVNGRLEKSLDQPAEPSLTADNALSGGERKDFEKQAGVAGLVAGPPPASQPVPQSPAFSESLQVTAESTSRARKRAKVAAASASVAPQAPPDDMSRMVVGGAAVAVQLANSKMPAIISAPGGSSMWRVGSGGRVEHSQDGGANWSVQSSGVIADLLAGSAPSDKVCWIVGRAATIVLTTDRGATWTALHAPVPDDLRAVFAVNAQQATIFTARDAYETTDGGLNWTKLAAKN